MIRTMDRRAGRVAPRQGARFVAIVMLAASTLSPAVASHRHCRYCEDIPWQWNDNESPSSENPPLPEGFVLTVPVPMDRQRAVAAPITNLSRYRDVADALARCWDPTSAVGDRPWGEVTLRVSFRRDGRINGIPRIVYGPHSADQRDIAEVRQSLLSALSRCSPLHFSPSLGNAVAGQIFAIRFVQQGPLS